MDVDEPKGLEENNKSDDKVFNKSTQDYLNNLKDVLNSEYIDVVKRLNLTYVPTCVTNQKFCREYHLSSNLNLKRCFPANRAKNFLYQDHTPLFIQFMTNEICLKEFPGDETFLFLVQMILNTKPNQLGINETDSFNLNNLQNDDVVRDMEFDDLPNETEDTLEEETLTSPTESELSKIADAHKRWIWQLRDLCNNFLIQFPPCWRHSLIECAYLKIIDTPIELEKINENFEHQQYSKTTISFFVISKIQDLMFEEDEQISENSENSDSDLELCTFDEYEKQDKKQYLFFYKTRKEKMQRLFVVLEFITKAMEVDMAGWMIRNAEDPVSMLFSDWRLLCLNFFGMTDIDVQETKMFKKVLNTFVLLICSSYSNINIGVFSRLVKLYCLVIQLSTTTVSSNGVEFPRSGDRMKNLAIFILNNIEENANFQIEKVIAAINWIEVPEIKYHIVNEFLHKFDKIPDEMCPRKVAIILKSEMWKEFSIKSTVENELLEPPKQAIKQIKEYPTIIKNKRKFQTYSTISGKQYLELLLEGLKAYCDHFAIGKCTQIFKIQNNPNNEIIENEEISFAFHKKRTFNVKDLGKKLPKRQKNKFDPNRKRNIPIMERNFQNISVDIDLLIAYRNHVKYLKIICEHLKMEKSEKLFASWIQFFQQNIFLRD